MFERHITSLSLIAPEDGEAVPLRDRLKANFPAGAARRMTLLGMMVGSAIKASATDTISSIVYSSEFGESLSLEGYLRSFPTASPTLFQVSIHPSAPQQGLILGQKPVREVIPLAGGPELVLQAALAAMINPAPDVLWCGGDERGTWLREVGVAADRSYAFAMMLRQAPAENSLGKLRLTPTGSDGSLSLPAWFDILRERRAWEGTVGTGWKLSIDWV